MINAIILEDEQHSIDLIEHYARRMPDLNIVAGYGDPREALERIKELPPIQLIFLDIYIPYMTAVQFMQAMPYQPKIILTTAYTEVNRAEFGDGVIDLLLKPFTFDQFEAAVRKLNLS